MLDLFRSQDLLRQQILCVSGSPVKQPPFVADLGYEAVASVWQHSFPRHDSPPVCGHCRFAHKTTSAATVHNQVFLHLHLDQIWTNNQPMIHKKYEYIYNVIRNNRTKAMKLIDYLNQTAPISRYSRGTINCSAQKYLDALKNSSHGFSQFLLSCKGFGYNYKDRFREANLKLK